ncbi:MAG: hypothetical protein HY823_15770 [Acidobacteria bacterium]|nr:hypothetical protein [Acidobacteriota bacterium]
MLLARLPRFGLALALTFAACGGGGGSSPGGGPQPSFSLTVSNATPTVTQGQTGPVTVSVVPANGFNGSVTFGLTGQPSGVVGTFAPPSAAASTILNLQVASGVNPGSYPLTVTGSAGSAGSQSAALTLAVGLGGSASGTISTDVFVVEGGQTVQVTGDLTVNASRSITILGSLVASGKKGQALTLTAQNDVSVPGTVMAGDGGPDQDGGTLTISSLSGKVSLTGSAKSGDGAGGVGATNGNGSTLPNTGRLGAGTQGGSLVLRARNGSIAFGSTPGSIQLGNGGKGLDISVQGSDRAAWPSAPALQNEGGSSGALILDAPSLLGMATTTITAPFDFPRQNPLILKGAAVRVPTSANVAGGKGGSAGSFTFGQAQAGAAKVRPGGPERLLPPVDAPDLVEKDGAAGADGFFEGGDGARVEVRGLPGHGPGRPGQDARAFGGPGGIAFFGGRDGIGPFHGDGRGGDAIAAGGDGQPGIPVFPTGGAGGKAIAKGGGGGWNYGGWGSAFGGEAGQGADRCDGFPARGGDGGAGGSADATGGNSLSPDRGGKALAWGGMGGNGGKGALGGGLGGAKGGATAFSSWIAEEHQGLDGIQGSKCPLPLLGGGVQHSMLQGTNPPQIYACGSNEFDQLGSTFPHQDANPLPGPGPSLPSLPAAFATGAYHNGYILPLGGAQGQGPRGTRKGEGQAVHAGGQVYLWGLNFYGQLGTGTYNNAGTPVPVPGLTNAVVLAPSYAHTLAVLADGTLRAWGGYSGAPLLGDGTANTSTTPVPVPGLTNVVSAATPSFGLFSLALKNDGSVWGWGDNGHGQLGDNSVATRATPVAMQQVPGGVTAIACGTQFSLLLRQDGTAWSCGQLGGTETHLPVQIPGLTNVSAMAAGSAFVLFLKGDGTVWALGANTVGQLGQGHTTPTNALVQVQGLANVTSIGAGASHGLARQADGSVWAWGLNDRGQLGDGSTSNRSVPVRMQGVTLN